MAMDRAYITFKAIKASLELSHGENSSKFRKISISAVLDENEDVRIQNDHSLRNSNWSIELSESEFYSEYVENLNAVGMLLYSKEGGDNLYYSPESCYVSIAFTPTRFESLLNSLQAGRMPEKITISVSGLTYGWEPDGRTKIWDTDANDALGIMSISLHLPLAAVQEPYLSDFISDGIEHTPASNTDIRNLSSELKKELARTLTNINKSNSTIAVLVLILIIVTLFK